MVGAQLAHDELLHVQTDRSSAPAPRPPPAASACMTAMLTRCRLPPLRSPAPPGVARALARPRARSKGGHDAVVDGEQRLDVEQVRRQTPGARPMRPLRCKYSSVSTRNSTCWRATMLLQVLHDVFGRRAGLSPCGPPRWRACRCPATPSGYPPRAPALSTPSMVDASTADCMVPLNSRRDGTRRWRRLPPAADGKRPRSPRATAASSGAGPPCLRRRKTRSCPSRRRL